MNDTNLKTFLATNLAIDEHEISPLLENYKIKRVQKDAFLLRPGEYCKQTFFVENGLLRQYSIDEKGKEHTISFAPENWFVTDRESVYFNHPTAYYIQALEDSTVSILDENLIQVLTDKAPSFTEFNNRLLHNHIRQLQNRINLLLSASAEERYLNFIEMYPDILLRVPQTMVASYLGITPESLSRVRKELAQKNFKK
ncbi:Crp/Fnr family transcriptional regulator [Gelidibacter sp.]|uniref:Crp/Fnr family transcriptional regulator n=1 Tax=Gelidibacter sp. TaxID=2018083 RepID=UPI0032677E1D